MFAAPCFWLLWFVSSIPLLVTLSLTTHGSHHHYSVTSHASFFCVRGYSYSESHNELREGVVNVKINLFVRIKLWLTVKTFSKFCCAYLQQGFLFPKFPFLYPPFTKQTLKNPSYFFHFPAYLKNYWQPCKGLILQSPIGLKPSKNATS